jgi:hypothetical protein
MMPTAPNSRIENPIPFQKSFDVNTVLIGKISIIPHQQCWCVQNTLHTRHIQVSFRKNLVIFSDPLTVDIKEKTFSNMQQNKTKQHNTTPPPPPTPPPPCAVDRLMTKEEIVKLNNTNINVCLEPLLQKVFHTETGIP